MSTAARSRLPRLFLLAVVSIAAAVAPGFFTPTEGSRAREKLESARLMERGMSAIRQAKAEQGVAVDPGDDPNATGLIGAEFTAITTTLGPLEAKRTSTNPAFAAVVVEMLAEAGVRRGDLIAAGFSGSFPALNLSVLAAAAAMGCDLHAITSITASTYGATDPFMTWLAMESALSRAGVFQFRSIAASPEGSEGVLDDHLFPGAYELAEQAVKRNEIPLIARKGFSANVRARMEAYTASAGGRRIAAFVNVGGAAYNLGLCADVWRVRSGLVETLPPCPEESKGVIFRMAETGMPVINLLNVKDLAARYGLPIDPSPLPALGEGAVFRARRFPFAALASLLFLVAVLSGYAMWEVKRGFREARPGL